MLPLRQRALTAARRSRPTGLRTSRSYASDSHGHGDHGHHAPAVEEGIGAAFYIAVGAIPVSMIAYSMAQPGKDGEPSSLTNAINSLSNFGKDWETRNHVRTVAMEQAAHDKHLLLYAGRNPHIEMKYPEAIQAGSPFNVPAGHYANMDKVVAHYRQQHLDEEDRKAQLAQKKAEAASKDYTQSGSNLPVPLSTGESATRDDDGDIAVIVNIGMDRNRVTGNPSSGRPGPPRPGPSHQWEDGSDASDTLVSSVDASIEGPRPNTTTTRSRLTMIEVPDDGDNSRLPQMPNCEFRQLDPDTIDRLMVPSPPTTLSRGLLTIEARERRERERELQARLFPGQRQEPPARQPSPADISTTISDESAVSPRSSPPPRSPRSPSIPDLPLPSSPGPVVSIKLINQDIGFGVFALTSFRKGDAIYEEDVALEATHDTHVIGRRDVAEEIKRLFRHDQPRLRTLFAAFPYLANIWLPTSSNDLSLDLIRLPSLVRGKGRVVCLIDPGEWQARFDAGAARVQRERHYMPFVRRTFHTDMLTTDWFGQYAFRLSPAEVSDAPHGAHHRAALYAVTCLINHHCAQFNCRVVAEPGRVRVLAHRDIAAGEELRINYQKDGRVRAGEFKCDCCEAAPGRLRRAVSRARAKTRVDKCSLI